MNLLLDTHVFLWWQTKHRLLTSKLQAIIQSSDNCIFISSVSVWEMSLKQSIKKLTVPEDPVIAIQNSNFFQLPITFVHAQLVGQLPWHHRDPFDRMLVAQAKVENLTLVTRDKTLKQYDIPIL